MYLYHLAREKVQFQLIFVIPTSRDWDTANLWIRDWWKWSGFRIPGNQSLLSTLFRCFCSQNAYMQY